MGETDGPKQGSETDALLRALRAPGTESELAEEERYRAMFRDVASTAQPAGVTRIRSRAPRRIVFSAAAAAALAVATGGVAAAYTGSLPDPIQTLAHHVIGAPGPSAAPVRGSTGRPSQSGTGSGGSTVPGHSSSSSARPHTHPTHRTEKPRHRPSGIASDAPTTGPTTGPTTSPTTGPTTNPSTGATATPGPVVTDVTLTGTSHLADAGGTVSFTGQVTTTADVPDPNRPVFLQERFGRHWRAVARGVSGPTGEVTLLAPSLQRTSVFRLRSAHVHSLGWRVAMHPLISTTVSASRKVATVTAQVLGGRKGDRVMLLTRLDGTTVTVGRARLGSGGTVSFLVAPSKRTSHYVVVVLPTRRHVMSQVDVRVRLTAKPS